MQKFFLVLFLGFSSQLLAQTDSSNKCSKTLMAFASDTQAPMWVETIVLKANNNRAATKRLFHDIAEKKPASLFILGDVVNLGYSNRQWKPMDGYLKKLRGEGIEVHAALGNHEVMGRSKAGQRKFQERFPNHVKTGFVEVVDSVAVVLLNSNFKKLSGAEDLQQVEWYSKTLRQLDEDSSIVFIISACHHSPYTNSKIVGASKDVQQRFIKPFMESPKSKLFLSGHCHGFEHYNFKGKDFMVIGGGGGLHQPLKTDGDFDDLAVEYKPMFHYLTVERKGNRLELLSYKLDNDFKTFEKGLAYNINLETAVGNDVASKQAETNNTGN